MLKNYSYRQKLKALPIALLIGLLVIYMVAIKETFVLRAECSHLREQTSMASDAPRELKDTQRELEEISSLTGSNSTAEMTDPLLAFVSSATEGKAVKLVDYQPIHRFENDKYILETRIAVFQGSYHTLLQLLWRMEKDYKKGIVVSSTFQTDTNLKTGEVRLLMTLYVQSIRQLNPDEQNSDETKY